MRQGGQNPKSILIRDATSIARLRELANSRGVHIETFPKQQYPTHLWEEAILRSAEMLYARSRAYTSMRSHLMSSGLGRDMTVVLVGAGIMNLMTAEFLATRGYHVHVVDASPSPKSCSDWTQLGVTHGGGNARMFTHTEADNYNETDSKTYQNMGSIFRQTVGNGGWSIKATETFTGDDLAWVNAFEQIPAWMARTFKDNIYQVNQEAGKLWKRYMEATPELFRMSGFVEISCGFTLSRVR